MMRSIVRVAVSFGAVATLLACGGSDAATGVRAAVTGSYTLSTVNGSPLPFTENSTGAVVKITAGTLVANSDGSFTETTTRSTTPPGGSAQPPVTTTLSGTYKVTGQVIVFTYAANGLTALGSVISGGVSIQNGANSFEYKK